MPIEYLHTPRTPFWEFGPPSSVVPVSYCFRTPSAPLPFVRVWYIIVLSSIINYQFIICPYDPRLFSFLSIYTHGCHTARLPYLSVIMYARIKGRKTGIYPHTSCSCIQPYGAGLPTLWGQMLSIQNKNSFHPTLLSQTCKRDRNRQAVLKRRERGKETTHIQHGPH